MSDTYSSMRYKLETIYKKKVENVLTEYKIHNAHVTFREDYDVDALIYEVHEWWRVERTTRDQGKKKTFSADRVGVVLKTDGIPRYH